MITPELEEGIRSIVREELAKRSQSRNEWMQKICNEVIAECGDDDWEDLINVCVYSDPKTPIPKHIDALVLKKAAQYLSTELSTPQKHNIRAALKDAVKKVAAK